MELTVNGHHHQGDAAIDVQSQSSDSILAAGEVPPQPNGFCEVDLTPRRDEKPPSGNPEDRAVEENLVPEVDAGTREAAPMSPAAVAAAHDESEENRGAEADDRDQTVCNGTKVGDSGGSAVISVIQPHSGLPKPEAPPMSRSPPRDMGATALSSRSQSLPSGLGAVDMPAIGKFIRERSNTFSAAIVKRLSSLKETGSDDDGRDDAYIKPEGVTEFNLSGLKVVVRLKTEEQPEKELRGRISFFSRSNCRDCTAVRCFFRERGLKFVEINVDVYPQREKELIQRTGSSQVPQIFFNEKLFGGLVALNSLRNSGGFDQRLKEMLARKCSGDAPAPPVYGFDDPGEEEEERADEVVGIVRVVRQRLPIQDRLMKMKIVKNCFAGSEMVEVLIHHLDCGRKKVNIPAPPPSSPRSLSLSRPLLGLRTE